MKTKKDFGLTLELSLRRAVFLDQDTCTRRCICRSFAPWCHQQSDILRNIFSNLSLGTRNSSNGLSKAFWSLSPLSSYLRHGKIVLLYHKIFDSLHYKVARLLHQLAEHRHRLGRCHSLSLQKFKVWYISEKRFNFSFLPIPYKIFLSFHP